MPAPPPESEPAIVSIAGVLPPPFTRKVFIVDNVIDGTQIPVLGVLTHMEILTVIVSCGCIAA